ncbi:hypothetical protein CK203_103776 [Vitis vinifera]|uniref:Uncharacterized protein n=1 Tax=Vitis vinifera TaxID=29760 RepID=A0A438CHZ7_VITVI|nr:hypothetical protein CK203_103776 [Vitis vinifera]
MRFNTKNQIRPWTTQMEIKSYLYTTGSVEIILDIAQDLLIATDQYLLQG